MKKLMLCVLLLVAAPLTFAEEATGTIEQIQICGTGHENSGNWMRTLVFKIDGKWFGIYANFYNSTATDYDSNITASMIYMAFAQNLEVHIKATSNWETYYSNCGLTDGHIFHGKAGDFISLSK
ncbi:hypothetical protein [Vibrio salinus]|uniref:hypothetical protein n=1 Tax=Vibrio salinus TaxID=2899784 RepID=UPI001E5E8E66|nr:hypothetical protein [Vibrio salinus]MCE0494152.1 hypothetical protein [Vibrio salinus]